jgi:hypothetical protein
VKVADRFDEGGKPSGVGHERKPSHDPCRRLASRPIELGQYRFFHCFGCKESGSAIDFVMKFDGVTFAESVRTLLKRGASV